MGHYVDAQLTLAYAMSSSLLKALLFFCLSSLVFVSYTQAANGESIYQQSLLRLNADNHSASTVQTLENYQGKPLLAAFFMPNCRWCQRQHKVLKKLQYNCPTIQTIMLGVQGSKQKLRHELKREKNTFPAYLANNNIIQAIGAQTPVPMMLFFNQQGKLVFKTVGYTPEKKLISLLAQYKVKACPA